jgi:hypothetical protein
MRIGKAAKTNRMWAYPFSILIALPAFILAESLAATGNSGNGIASDAIPHKDVENTPAEIHDDLIDQLEYAEPEEPEENYAIVEDDEGERFLLVNPLAKRANYNPSFNSMLRLDKKASHYNPSFNSMLRLDKKGMKTHQGFANMLRLDKKANYNPAFNSMLRLDKRTPYRNSNFAGMLRLDKKAGSYGPSFASNMLRLDKKAVYNPGFNSMLRLDKKYSPNNFNAFSNQLRLDKRSFKSSLRNFGLLRLDA